ncbi:hypothetical protein VOLCADRAFT_118758 [Volvox carteri f. nagariensis]|uniref:Cytochrome P450 n=1 Tax=Volvox carteri f. nagariensis TaxID=3068 RepID=D8U7A3_VOLCA|nr:uncharacterized protein VOLCADRAFT_118758 [Volvox carteri f. nagariensis]EFJ44450.1 hypothetical protein VOLCADRAFT_118758 [Volvox carteri f. nagariensis]|eukprot:XP_002954557.1 hypothetical protein VOLCADRAFT_118758 [Volvox carteri f. nagariensis]
MGRTLTWMLFALDAHPEAAAKLEEELRSHDPVLAAFLALHGSHEALSSLPYLDAFVRECLRMFSVAPNGAVKVLPPESPPTRIGPYEVEPGTTVWVPFWSLHLSERNWERPLEFQPERWMNLNPRTGFITSSSSSSSSSSGSSNGASGSGDTSGTAVTTFAARCPVAAAAATTTRDVGGAHHHQGVSLNNNSSSSCSDNSGSSSSSKATRYMPFSEGSRNCVGQHLGMLQIKAVLSYLFSRFRFRLDDQRMGGVEGALARQRVNLTLEVEGGMWMAAELRSPRRGQQQQVGNAAVAAAGAGAGAS